MRFTKPIAVALAVTVGALAFAGSAEAGHRHRHGDAALAGLFGFAAGAIVAGALAQPRYHPDYYYYQPAPVELVPPPPVIYELGPVYSSYSEPWTPEWYAYCEFRYISFDESTGYFLGFDGEYHFCR